MLAPRPQQEKFLTVSCSHFAAGVRAIIGECQTPEQSIWNAETKCIDIHDITSKDPIYADVIENGFEFMVIPWYVESVVEGIAELAQSALNAEHSTYTLV